MTNSTLRASRKAAPWLRYGETLMLPAAAAVFLTLTDAFGLDVLPVGLRLLYWLVLLGIGQFGSLAIRASLDRMAISRSRLILAGVLQCLLLSLLMTVVVWLATSLALAQPLRAVRLPAYFLPVLVVVTAMVSIGLMAQRRPVETHGAPAAGTAPILARLPPKLKMAALYAVQAEDHYVRLHTSAGSDLVLLRFADAMAELRGIEGAQVHRSWWVARDAIQSSRRQEGKLFLILHGGTTVPVSRTYIRALRTEGWL